MENTVDSDRLIPVNVAEAIIDPFYENQFSVMGRYAFTDLLPGRSSRAQQWHFLSMKFDVRDGDDLLGALSRRCAIDASGYDSFLLRISLSANVRIVALLTVDGVTQRVVDAPGAGGFHELSGPFKGSIIEGIRIEFRAIAAGRAVAMLEWTMLASGERMPLLSRSRPRYDPAWKGYIRVGEVKPEEMTPSIGIYFGKEDLEALRRKALMPQYAAVMANLRNTAARFMALTPENHIAEAARYLYPFTRDRLYYVPGMPEFYVGASACALVGLLDGDAAALRMAARIALSQAFCGSWGAWLETVPDTVWEDRGFPNFIIGVGCAMSLDWAGCMLTDLGKEFLVKAIADKALPRIQQSLMKHDYMWYSNQGAWDLYGAVVCTVAVASRWPHGDMYLDGTMEILRGIMDRYIAEDGGSFEGVNYQAFTMTFAMLASVAWGRFRGRDPGRVAPPGLARSVDYLLAMLSQGSHPGSFLPLADGGPVGTPLAPGCVALLRHLFGRTELDPLLAHLLPRTPEDSSMRIDNPAVLIFGPEEFRAGAPSAPVFRILENSGLLTSSRPVEDGSVRVVLTGCQEKDAGHSHHDRGSLILEAFGETLLNENGMIDYEIAEHVLLGEPRYHCIACPGPMDGLPKQTLPTPSAILPSGHGDARRLAAEVTTTAAWGGNVRAASRRVESENPEEILVIDSFELAAPGPVTVLWNTTGTIEARGGGYRITVGKAVADIEPRWAPARARIEENLYNAAREPCRVLMLEAPPSARHALATRIRISRGEGRRTTES